MYEIIIPLNPYNITEYYRILCKTINNLVGSCTDRYGIICSIIGDPAVQNIVIRKNSPLLILFAEFNAKTIRPERGKIVLAIINSRIHNGFKLFAVENDNIHEKYMIYIKDNTVSIGDIVDVKIQYWMYDGEKFKCIGKIEKSI